jgi:hypothetical protein
LSRAVGLEVEAMPEAADKLRRTELEVANRLTGTSQKKPSATFSLMVEVSKTRSVMSPRQWSSLTLLVIGA